MGLCLCEVILYQHYVDGIICLLSFENNVEYFVTFLSSRHPNIKFTFEKENDNKISFLCVYINKTKHSFCTSVFKKSASFGLDTSFSSFIPFFYKIRLIKTLIDQSFTSSSFWNFFNDEIYEMKH